MKPRFVIRAPGSASLFTRARVACLALLSLAASAVASAAVVNATYHSAGDVPVTASGYTAGGNTVNLTLNFAPSVGTELMVVKNTAPLAPISGTFGNLAQGQIVSLPFGGVTYKFAANYFGGTGNDLVLAWANTRIYAWGFPNYLGGSSWSNLPLATDMTGVLAGKTVTAVATGFSHSLALCSDGTLAAWGDNREGEVGDNSTSFRFLPVAVNAGPGSALQGKTVVAISAGVQLSVALCSDGTVVAWGKNQYGEVGDGTTTRRLLPTAVNRSGGSSLVGKTVVAIRAGARHVLALCSDGTIAAWGFNANAQLGDNTTDNRSTPVRVNTGADSALAGRTPIALAAGNYHSLALCSDGAVLAWGNNNDGQLGQADPVTVTVKDTKVDVPLFNGSTYTLWGQTYGLGFSVPGTLTTYTTVTERRVPGLVQNAQGISALFGRTPVAIHAGTQHSLVLCSDGTVVAWGANGAGQIGDGTTEPRRTAVEVSRGAGSALAGKSPLGIGGGRQFNTVISSDGTVAAWGENKNFVLGDDTEIERRLPNPVGLSSLEPGERYLRVSAGNETSHTLAIVAVPLRPEMTVFGNNAAIASGALTPTTTDHTDFGSTVTGVSITRTFTIKNTGPALLNLSGSPKVTVTGPQAGDFTVTQQPASPLVGSTGTTTFQVTFNPTDGGVRVATISIANDDFRNAPYTFAIQGSGPLPDMSVLGNNTVIANGDFSPSTTDHTDFENATLSNPVVRTFTIRNAGAGNLSLTGTPKIEIDGDGDFVVTTAPASSIAHSGGTTTFQVTFAPLAQGLRGALVSIPSNDANQTPYFFRLWGIGPKPVIAVSGNNTTIAAGDTTPSVADFTDFGTASLGATITRTFTITNSGQGALTISKLTLTGADAGDFAITQPPAGTVARDGGTTTFQITFTAAAINKRSTATVNIENDDFTKSQFRFALHASGPVPDMDVLGNNVVIPNRKFAASTADFTDFGPSLIGTPVQRTFTIRNAGAVALTLTGTPKVAVSGTHASDFVVTQQPASSVAPNGTTTFTVAFTPSANRTRSATLTIASNDLRKAPYTFSIIGSGPTPDISVLGNNTVIANGDTTPGTADFTDFGTVEQTDPPAVRTFTIRNSGTASLVLPATPKVSVLGAAGDFIVTQQPTSPVANNGGTTTFQVTFTPITSGLRSAVVTIANDDANKSVYTFAIQGKGPTPQAVVGIPFAWGVNTSGSLGTGTAGDSLTPVASSMTGLLAGKTLSAAASGDNFHLVLASDGKIYAWGDNSNGQLGNNSTTNSNVPVAVDFSGALNGKTITAIAAGGNHSLALTSDGKVYAWGANADGQLGNGTNTQSLVPVAVTMTGALNGKTVSSVAAGFAHSVALATDGKVYTWGANNNGQLGDDSTTPRNVPVAVDPTSRLAERTATAIAAAGDMGMAMTSDNRVYCWGFQGNGQLGNSDWDAPQKRPIRVNEPDEMDGKFYARIAMLPTHAMALMSDGTVWSWGLGTFGALGNNATTKKEEPVAVVMSGALNGKKVAAIGGGWGFSVALTTDGNLYTWGRGGRLGNGSNTDSLVPVAVTMNGALNGKKALAISTGGAGDSIVILGTPDAGSGDSGGGSSTNPVAAVADTYSVNEDGTLTVAAASGVLANDTGTSLAATLVRTTDNGTLTLNANGGFTYQPTANFSGTDTFTYLASNSSGAAGPITVTITVNPVNDVPTLTLGANVTVLQDSGAYPAGAGFATFTPGAPTDELSQTLLGYTLTNTNNALFSSQPAIDDAGLLSFTLAKNARGSATVTVVARDSGGTANGGVDSVTKTFTITVTPLNLAPTATLAASTVSVFANSGAYAAGAGFATFSPGPSDESAQTLVSHTLTNTNNALFSAQPALSNAGVLTFTPALNQSGSAQVTVTTRDSGGTANGGSDTSTAMFQIVVRAVNAAPNVTFASSTVTVVQNSGAYAGGSGFATFSPGPASESLQSLISYTVTNSLPGLFSVQPALSNAGTLTFTLAASARGTATVTVVARDNGGTANGGVDSVTKTFTISVLVPNAPPTVTFASAKVVAAINSGAQSLTSFATFAPGADSESAQSLLSYTVTNDNNALFSAQPALSNAGVLTFTPATGATGTAKITVVVRDNGGTAGGGIDSSTSTFNLEIKGGSMFVVTNTNDSGPGSLRQAILDANAAGGAVTILCLNNLGVLNPASPLAAIGSQVTFNPGVGNSLSGTLLVGSGGSLNFDGATLPGGNVSLLTGGRLAGTGALGGDLGLTAGGTFAPGSSPGVHQAGTVTWTGGGVYEFEINDASGAAGSASDLLTVAKTLTFTATPASQATIKLKTLNGTAAGAMANFDPAQSYSWTLARLLAPDSTEPLSTAPRIVGFDGAAIAIDRTGFANSIAGGRFSLYVTSTELRLAFLPNHPPVPVDDTYDVDQGDALVRTPSQGLLANDIDSDFSPVTVSVLTQPANGTVNLNGDGAFTYTPNAAFYGTDTFTYTSNDGTLPASRDGVVTIAVHARPVNTVPGAQLVFHNKPLRFTAARVPVSNAIRVADPDSTDVTVALGVTQGALGVTTTTGLTVSGSGSKSLTLSGSIANVNAGLESLSYQPPTNYSGPDTITLATTDEGSRASRGNGSIALTVLPPPAITSGTTASGTYKSSFAFAVTATGVELTYGATGLPPGLAINPATGAITGAPTSSGPFAATVSVTDGGGNVATGPLAISVAKVNLTVAGVTAASRIYDATNVATLDTASASLVGVVSGDTVNLIKTGAAGTFADKLVGTNRTVTIAGLQIDGTHAVHYTLTQPTATASITAKTLTLTGVTAENKIFDSSTAAAVGFTKAALVGIVSGDKVTLITTSAVAAFNSPNAGTTKPITITGLRLGDTDAGNYVLTVPVPTADILRASVAITITNLAHVYDGTAKTASVSLSPPVAAATTYSAPPLNAGSYTVSVAVSDPNYIGTSSATLTIAKATQTVSLSAPATASLGNPISVTASASTGLPVTLAVSGPATLAGSQLSFTAPGVATVTATQAGNTNYESATASATITVAGKLAQTIAFSSISDRLSNSGSFALNATASSGLPVSFAIVSGPAMLSGNVVTLTGAAGSVLIRASQPGNAVYNPAPDVNLSFTVTAATLNVFFGPLTTTGNNNTKTGDVAATLPPNSRQGSLLVVSGLLNTVLDFTLNADGTFTQTVIADVSNPASDEPGAPARAAAPMTLTITGSLVNGRLQGVVQPLGLAFNAAVLPVTGPSANAAGFYRSSTLSNSGGAPYSVVGTQNEVLVLAQTTAVTTGGLTTLNADGTFAFSANTTAGMATIRGSVDEPTTTVSGSISLAGRPDMNFAGLLVTTTRTDRLVNLSSRVRIGTGDRVLITGFVIGGNEPKQVLVRGIGPALANFGVQGVLANPRIRIYRGSEIIAENDDWAASANAGALASTFSRLGAFGLAPDSRDAALLTTLPPGTYTAQVLADGNGAGVALAEIYDASVNPNSDYQRLINISTRGEAGTGENILIGGFIVTGNAPKKLLIRGIGPGLAAFGVGGTLADPRLRVFRGSTVLAENDNWSSGTAADTAAVADAARATGAFTLSTGSRDAALILTLAPGAYTAQVGAADNLATGVALVEIYEIPE